MMSDSQQPPKISNIRIAGPNGLTPECYRRYLEHCLKPFLNRFAEQAEKQLKAARDD